MTRTLLALICAVSLAHRLPAAERPPNVVIVFADDLGYGDLGCFGATGWTTPHLDRLAAEGVKFTSFLVSQPVCSASRASLLTGCYANRLGIHGALGPNARHGIADTEMTLAQLVKQKGYATGMAGKWHLGHHPPFLPTRHGFDESFGLPYSNDMWPHHPEAKTGTYPPLPLFEGEKVVTADVTADVQATLTRRYTERAVAFIEKNRERPFFFYLAHSMPHVPLFPGEKFRGTSKQGTYGDVVQEIDWSVGEVLGALRKHGLEKNTLVIFTSDNGPWLSYGNHAGTAGKLREGKGTVFEGGVREPFIARWPGVIPANSVQHEPAMTIDLFPTIAKLIGAELPRHPIDGKDIGPLLRAEPGAKCPHEAYFHYYNAGELQAVRSGNWKLMLPHTARSMNGQEPGKNGTPGKYRALPAKQALYDLAADVGETTDLAEKHRDVVERLLGYAERARADLGDALTKRTGTGVRAPGRLPPARKDVPYAAELVFPLHPKHNHAPGIVECPNGDLLASWYRGSGERSADDVAVYGARLKSGEAAWSEAFLLADTPGFPDCNTALFVDPQNRLWLFWPVILANSWESCLTHYRTSTKFDGPGAPTWDWQGVLALKPKDFETTMLREFAEWKKQIGVEPVKKTLGDDYVRQKVSDKLLSRLGWQPRCKPTLLKSGRILLPLYSDTYNAGLMAITDDGGKTWSASTPLAGFGSIQPSVLEKGDGTLVAYMRENGLFKKVRVAESKDQGTTWGTVGSTTLPNPGSGLDAVKLANGHFLLVYNDTTRGRSSLAVSISDDEGKTWKWTRHIEKHDSGSYHYPAVIQAKNGAIHVIYSYFVPDGKSMKHARFTEAWVQAGDAK